MSTGSPNSVLTLMLESGEFSDLKFVCNEQEFKVHKAVVCGQSRVIKAATQEGFKESHTNVIIMDDFQPNTVKRMVQFMYTGDYHDSNDESEVSVADQEACLGNNDGIEEVSLSGDRLKFCAGEEENMQFPASEPPSPSLQGSTATTSLFKHVRVNSIGGYYNIDRLVSLANTKIKRLLWSDNEDKSWVARLPSIIEAALGSTRDHELLDILASAAAANISTLLDLGQFENLNIITGFAVRVLRGCVREHQALRDELREMDKRYGNEIDLQRRQIQDVKSEISSLKGCLAVLNKRSGCRNCGAEFHCFIYADECLLRCAKCRCKHYD